MKLRNLFLAALPLLAAACSDDDSEGGAGNRTPMSFAASIQAVSRLTVNDSWAGHAGSQVGVQIGDEVKAYIVGEDGSLTSSDPFYWEDFTGTITASAWYPYTEGGKPAVVVSADQSVPANYLASDLLEAADTEVAVDNAALTFTHRTAKVECRFKLKDGEEGTLNGATVVLLNLTGVDNGTSVTTSGDFHALVAPQTIPAGTDFVEVRMENGGSHVGALDEDLNLAAGYLIPIELEIAPDKMTVTVDDPQAWDESGSSGEVDSESPNVVPGGDGGQWTPGEGSGTVDTESPEVGMGDGGSDVEWTPGNKEEVSAETRE